jgi:predicted GNAT family acetyltransferase
VEVEHVTGADAVLERVETLVLSDEARHNLALGILSTARAQPGTYRDVRGWIVRDDDRVVAGALCTPPHNLVLGAPLRMDALDVLADGIEDDLPGVVGATPEVDRFAGAWATRRGAAVTPVMEQRIYALRELIPPLPTEGAMRLADESDRELLVGWVLAFARETRGKGADVKSMSAAVATRLADPSGGFVLWEAAERAVSLACFGGTTPNGIRISAVYTPAEHRSRGYGSAVTAAASAMLLDRGHRFCFLYTDLANPTSNSIYMRIGYEPVCDSRELAFSTA